MKHMKVARGTARAKRRATNADPSLDSKLEALIAQAADIRSHLRRLAVTLFHKSGTAKLARNSPFA